MPRHGDRVQHLHTRSLSQVRPTARRSEGEHGNLGIRNDCGYQFVLGGTVVHGPIVTRSQTISEPSFALDSDLGADSALDLRFNVNSDIGLHLDFDAESIQRQSQKTRYLRPTSKVIALYGKSGLQILMPPSGRTDDHDRNMSRHIQLVPFESTNDMNIMLSQ
jgi:hypothetical protein